MTFIDEEVEEQKASNLSAVPYYDSFSEHRERLTSLLTAGPAKPSKSSTALRLCVLGAGNCYDLDLERLAQHYSEIHLVDIDAAALARAAERQTEATRTRIFRHAPVDVSGLLDKLGRWKDLQVSPDELLQHAELTSEAIVRQLPGPFDVVLSACMLTQMQLMVLKVLSDTHRLFEAVRFTLNVTHLRTLAALTAPAGRGLLATDVSSDLIAPLKSLRAKADLTAVLAELSRSGRVIYVSDPPLIAKMADTDPVLRAQVSVSPPIATWLWRNGPERVLLVYALELRRKARR